MRRRLTSPAMRCRVAGSFLDAPIGAGGDRKLRGFAGETFSAGISPLRKREAGAEDKPASPFKNHTHLVKELVDGAVEREIPGDFAFDCYLSSAERLNHIQDHERGYMGDLKSNRKVRFMGGEMKAAEWASGIAPDDRQQVGLGDRN